MNFPSHRQLDEMDCGPACLKMIAEHHGKLLSLQTLREKCYITRVGVSLLGISEAAESLGYRTIAVKITYGGVAEQLGLLDFPLPCIVHWQQRHFIVVYKINAKYVWVSDPAHGRLKLKRADFEAAWCSDGDKGIALGLEPTPEFYNDKTTESVRSKSLLSLLPYLKPYKQLLTQLGLGFLIGLLFQLLIPFLAQSLIDVGVNQGNLSFVWLVLGAQLALFVMQSAVQFLQSWILLQIGRRISVNLVADFLTKLMRLPLGFFDSKNIGDLTQRIADNARIEGFLTGSLLTVIFAVFSMPIFSIILLSYSTWMFGVFVLAAVAYFSWILLFMRWRRKLDYLAFQQVADNQQNLYELISGMTEIKLQGSERKHRWRWMDIQGRLFRIQSKSLALRQYQEFGASFINRLKDIIISVIAAQAVIKGEMTLGMMMAAQYIVAQLNSPFEQMIGFLRAAQDARMSLERINEVTNMPDEDAADLPAAFNFSPKADLILQDVSFSYTPISPSVLNNVNLTIPQGKVTAIVGASGSGKTTLLKLLLGFYPTSSGKISVGTLPLNALNKRFWRQQCGTVMQDGFIFSDTIAANIAESAENIDFERLQQAIRVANLETYIYGLPLGLNTIIGSRGVGLSQGQRQRLLIARAVYKNPAFLFFDEATNALDANNEREIVQHLNAFFEQKTVVVVAHRLSTVRHADKIIVLDAGRIVEEGTHEELVALRGQYYTLIQNQLELGN